MVHALRQAHRVVVPNGYLVDVRPERDPSGRRAKLNDIYCVSEGLEIPAGTLKEPSTYYADYRAADLAVRRVLRQGLFTLLSTEMFRIRYYFPTLSALDDVLAQRWAGTTLAAPSRRRLETLLRRHPRGQIMVNEVFRLNVMQKR